MGTGNTTQMLVTFVSRHFGVDKGIYGILSFRIHMTYGWTHQSQLLESSIMSIY